jgi:hypothetical protein
MKSRRMRRAGHVARMWETRSAYEFLVGDPEREKPLGRIRCRCKNNIKIDLKDKAWDCVYWVNVAHDRDRGKFFYGALQRSNLTQIWWRKCNPFPESCFSRISRHLKVSREVVMFIISPLPHISSWHHK